MRIIEAGDGDGVPTDASGFERWVREEREELRHRLVADGAILFRGFLPGEPEAFEGFVEALDAPSMRYRGGVTKRTRVQTSIYTSTDAPSYFPIPLHNEMSYADRYPAALAFFCERPPHRGGRTPLSDAREVWRSLDGETKDRLERHGVRYRQVVPERSRRTKTWPEMFETSERAEVEAACRELGMEAGWSENGSLALARTRPASVAHPRTGERVWFNQINVYHPSFSAEFAHSGRKVAATLLRGVERVLGERAPSHPMEVALGDGAPIPRRVVDQARAALWEHETSFPWSRGDLLLVDNLRVAHGREPYRGERSILAALFEEWG